LLAPERLKNRAVQMEDLGGLSGLDNGSKIAAYAVQ